MPALPILLLCAEMGMVLLILFLYAKTKMTLFFLQNSALKWTVQKSIRAAGFIDILAYNVQTYTIRSIPY
mgnify:CR=1 FL=1